MCILSAHVSVHHVHVAPTEARRGLRTVELELLIVVKLPSGSWASTRTLQEQLRPRTAKPSLQPHSLHFFKAIYASNMYWVPSPHNS